MERLADELDLTQRRVEIETAALVEAVIARRYSGSGRDTCIDCGSGIAAARRQRVPNAVRCFDCQERFERNQQALAPRPAPALPRHLDRGCASSTEALHPEVKPPALASNA